MVANVDPGTFGMIDENGYPEKIGNQDDFERFHYQPIKRESLTSLPSRACRCSDGLRG